ncbi:hypothetical protein Pcinc_034670, partial [Petrolisthes cinctipes]
ERRREDEIREKDCGRGEEWREDGMGMEWMEEEKNGGKGEETREEWQEWGEGRGYGRYEKNTNYGMSGEGEEI